MDESRITTEPGKRSGQPCIPGLRITVFMSTPRESDGGRSVKLLLDVSSGSPSPVSEQP